MPLHDPIASVRQRSNGQCEGMIKLPNKSIYTRCWRGPIEVHHLLTKARGGRILDSVGEDYHLIGLCPDCHRRADGGDAYMEGLLIDGYVVTVDGRPVYEGSDEYLRSKYGKSRRRN